MTQDSTRTAARYRLAKIAFAVLTTGLAAVLVWYLYRYADPSTLLVQQDNQLSRALILLGLFVVKALTLVVIESSLLYVAAAIFFPLEIAMFIVFIGVAIEVTIEFLLGVSFGRKRVRALLAKLQGRKPLLDRLLSRLTGSDPFVIVLLRLLPGFHNGLTGLVLGASGTSLLVYLPASLLGMLPKAIATIWMGKSLLDPLSVGFLLPLALYLAAVGLALLLRRTLKQRVPHNDSPSE